MSLRQMDDVFYELSSPLFVRLPSPRTCEHTVFGLALSSLLTDLRNKVFVARLCFRLH